MLTRTADKSELLNACTHGCSVVTSVPTDVTFADAGNPGICS
ncbi:hypothetical protein ACFOEY_19750 [Paracandidimonas soli]